jgi:hypothetical protein
VSSTAQWAAAATQWATKGKKFFLEDSIYLLAACLDGLIWASYLLALLLAS